MRKNDYKPIMPIRKQQLISSISGVLYIAGVVFYLIFIKFSSAQNHIIPTFILLFLALIGLGVSVYKWISSRKYKMEEEDESTKEYMSTANLLGRGLSLILGGICIAVWYIFKFDYVLEIKVAEFAILWYFVYSFESTVTSITFLILEGIETKGDEE